MFDYNMDYKRRDELLFGANCQPEEKWAGGIKYFSITPSVMRQLIDEGFVDVTEKQNDSPDIGAYMEFLESLEDNVAWRINGYAVSHNRGDYRISVEGCETNWPSYDNVKDVISFANLFRFADDFELSPSRAYCWFD